MVEASDASDSPTSMAGFSTLLWSAMGVMLYWSEMVGAAVGAVVCGLLGAMARMARLSAKMLETTAAGEAEGESVTSIRLPPRSSRSGGTTFRDTAKYRALRTEPGKKRTGSSVFVPRSRANPVSLIRSTAASLASLPWSLSSWTSAWTILQCSALHIKLRTKSQWR